MLPISSSSALLLSLSLALSSVSGKPHGINWRRHRELEERMKPITATTTMTTQITETQTIWVKATDNQATFGVGSGSASSGDTPSSTSSAPAISSTSSMMSAVPSSKSSASSSVSGSTILIVQPSGSSMISMSATASASSSASRSESSTSLSDLDYSSTSSVMDFSSIRLHPSSSAPIPSASASAASSASGSGSESELAASSTVMSSSASPSASMVDASSHLLITSSSAAPSGSHAPSPSASGSLSGSHAPSPPAISGSHAPSPSGSGVAASSSASIETEAVSSTSGTLSKSSAPQPSRSSGSGPAQPSPTKSTASSMSSSKAAASSSAAHSATSGEAVESASSSSMAASSSMAVSSSMIASSTVASSSSSTAPSSSASSNNALSSGPLMNGYYPDWSGWYLSPENVDWSKFDVIDFAFALPTSDNDLQFTQDDSSDLLTRLVKTGHAAGKKVKLSIGGWTGSQYFSDICASSSRRATFVSNILKAYNQYNLDGIDIDWEYPGVQGASGNSVSGNDSANFLKFLTQLRKALPDGALISLATQVWPFADSNGNPMTDVSGFANVIDWILIMNYDIWGSSSTPGANAPLSDGCHNSTQPLANAYSAVASWTSANMPANKITLGVPAYGYLQKSWATQLQDRKRSLLPRHPHKREASNYHPMFERGTVTIYNDNGGDSDGQIMFESLISQGALVDDGNGGFEGAGGFFRVWDECSSTPFLKSWDSGQIVTYDDPASMSLKGQFAAQAGIRGCNVFSIDGDYTGYSWPLTDAVRSGMGL